MEYDKQLEEYGILAKNTEKQIEDNKITIISAQIDEINFQTLQEKNIEEIYIFKSEIKHIYFANKTTIDIKFECCNFKLPIIARAHSFNNTITFHQCIFESIVDFSRANFSSKVDFLASTFKAEARFINTKFLAKQGNGKIENNFRESVFEGNTSFGGAKFKGRVNFSISRFKAEARFINTKFLAKQGNGKIENNFSESVFEGNTSFGSAKFKGRVNFYLSNFRAEARFIETQFLAEQSDNEIIENNFIGSIFEGNTSFGGAKFKGRVNFSVSRFKAEVLFAAINPDKCIFRHTEFNKTKFINIDCKNTETYTFRNSIFKDTLSFEKLNISKLIFDNVVFNSIVTFNKAKLDNKPHFINCTFSNQFNIMHEHIQYSYEEIKKTQDYNQLLNYRDLFRKLKSNRIAHHNLIDASELHSQELYARELELKHKETKTIKDKVDYWQLWLYRKLCDHHTDILKSFHSLILVIGLFGLMGLVVIAGFNYYLGYESIFSHLYMIKEIYDAHIQSFIKTHTLCTFLFNIFILGVYLLMLFISIKWKIPRVFLIGVSYAIVICILLVSPKILIPAMGIFTDKRELLDPLSTLGGIYTIIFGFVLFSFIKTIRKNSIVPN